MQSEPLWNQTQTGNYLGKSPRTLEGWRVSGIGPEFLKIGGHIRYDPEKVKAWAQHQRRRSTSDPGKVAT